MQYALYLGRLFSILLLSPQIDGRHVYEKDPISGEPTSRIDDLCRLCLGMHRACRPLKESYWHGCGACEKILAFELGEDTRNLGRLRCTALALASERRKNSVHSANAEQSTARSAEPPVGAANKKPESALRPAARAKTKYREADVRLRRRRLVRPALLPGHQLGRAQGRRRARRGGLRRGPARRGARRGRGHLRPVEGAGQGQVPAGRRGLTRRGAPGRGRRL